MSAVPFLVANKPRQTQFRDRRAAVTGLIVVHTAESPPDVTGPDDGCLNVARFIQGRADYGSYHLLGDSDSKLQLVPFSQAAYGDGTGSNEFAIHVSGATQAARWPTLSQEWREGCVRNMASAAADAAKWLKQTHDITVPARRVSKAESDRGVPGFISHGERDPGRRSDPGASFPWEMFFAEFRKAMAPPDPHAGEIDVLVAHLSMQFSDTPDQMRIDAEKLFNRAKLAGRKWVTGTEAGGKTGPTMRAALKTAASANGYRFHYDGGDTWVAVEKSSVNRGTWQTGFVPVLGASTGVGMSTAKGITWASWVDGELGSRVSVGVGHYLTKGKPATETPDKLLQVNLEHNMKYAEAIAAWAKTHGKGGNLAFYAGDQNIVDRESDTFLGGPLTSSWDDLGKYENTGHGNIDVLARYDRDGRVRAKEVDALPDKEVFFHTDHYLVTGTFGVMPKVKKPKKPKKPTPA